MLVKKIKEVKPPKNPRIEFEVADLEPIIESEDVEDAVRNFFDQEPELELRVSLSKTPYRGNRKAYVYGRMYV